ncbi:peptide deformylase [Sinorhizobium sp. 8-89]|uniref:peptide deformylase n=1 Tax=Sinorhizobium sp. 7-81 TaxID=3049087 RepID=UPI0024C4374E|nr:peptide deformylase [Sinorhizobium sp. 7-81]MDK1388029.1 peptide deformylase [Sinorhizobium sp. 7-81]
MAILPIVRFPHPALATAAETIEHFDDDLRQLATDLLETMRAAPGIGITANHVGVLRRLMVIELDQKSGARTFVNPQIIWQSEDLMRHAEGSVSMPGISEEVERPRAIRVRFQSLSGGTLEEYAEGLMAICLQHEIDQLSGIFWTQRLSRLKRERAIKRFEKLTRAER